MPSLDFFTLFMVALLVVRVGPALLAAIAEPLRQRRRAALRREAERDELERMLREWLATRQGQ